MSNTLIAIRFDTPEAEDIGVPLILASGEGGGGTDGVHFISERVFWEILEALPERGWRWTLANGKKLRDIQLDLLAPVDLKQKLKVNGCRDEYASVWRENFSPRLDEIIEKNLELYRRLATFNGSFAPIPTVPLPEAPPSRGQEIALVNLDLESLGLPISTSYDGLDDLLEVIITSKATGRSYSLVRHIHAPAPDVEIWTTVDSASPKDDLKDCLEELGLDEKDVIWERGKDE